MKTFEKDHKINFVDDANVLVGFDNGQSCCENFGTFLSRKIPTKISEEGSENIDTEGFNFDTTFFKEVHDLRGYDVEEMAIFRLTKGDEEIFLTLYNSHNGYYSHGFEMIVGGTQIHGGCL